MTRARIDPQTKAYLERKQAEGKTKREALRCLKRHLHDAYIAFTQCQSSTPIRLPSMPQFPGGA